MGGDAPRAPAPRSGNLGYLVIAQGIGALVAIIVQVYLARALGREGFGVFSFLVAIASLFAAVAQMNLQLLVARDVARAPEQAGAMLGRGLVTTAALSVLATAGIVVYVALFAGRPGLLLASALAGVALGARSLGVLAESVFQGLRRMGAVASATVISRAVLLAATVVAVSLGAGIPGVFGAQVASGLTALGVMGLVFHRRIGSIVWRTSTSEVRALIWAGRQYGLNQVFSAIYLSSDLLVLAAFRGDGDVGLYRAASLLVIQLPIVALVLNRAVYPRMARLVGDPRAAGAELALEVRLLLAVSLPIAVGGLCVAEPLLVYLVGDAYRAGTPAFLWLLGMVPLRFVNNALGNALSALDRQEARTRGVAVAAFLNLAANLVAVPIYGVVGAAVTTVLTEVVLFVWLARSLGDRVRDVPWGEPLLRAAAPTAAMALVVLAVPGWHVLARVAVGAALYVGLSWLSGAWRAADVRALRAL